MQYIKKRAQSLVEKYCTNDPFELCALLGIFVFYPELPKTVKGVYYKIKDYQMVGINSSLDADERRAVCAHELGHALLHPEMNLYFSLNYTNFPAGKFERQADYFCACLLVDANRINSMKCEDEQLTVQSVASQFHLQEDVVDIWLREEKII